MFDLFCSLSTWNKKSEKDAFIWLWLDPKGELALATLLDNTSRLKDIF